MKVIEISTVWNAAFQGQGTPLLLLSSVTPYVKMLVKPLVNENSLT